MKKGRLVLCTAVITASLALCAACQRKAAAIYDSNGEEAGGTEETGEEAREPLEEALPEVCVYVCGEVLHPGVYELPGDARMADAVEAAGGMTREAAEGWLNLAERLSDGQKIEVPSVEELERISEEAERSIQENGLVNLNTATAEQLMTLTGIGEAKAQDILAYREAHGGFSAIEELMEIPGIKEGIFQKIKDKIIV